MRISTSLQHTKCFQVCLSFSEEEEEEQEEGDENTNTKSDCKKNSNFVLALLRLYINSKIYNISLKLNKENPTLLRQSETYLHRFYIQILENDDKSRFAPLRGISIRFNKACILYSKVNLTIKNVYDRFMKSL